MKRCVDCNGYRDYDYHCNIKNEFTNIPKHSMVLRNELNEEGQCKDYKRIWYKFWRSK